jgi:hypothetical protein
MSELYLIFFATFRYDAYLHKHRQEKRLRITDMKKRIHVSIIAALILPVLCLPAAGNRHTVTPEESARILGLIFSKSVSIYRKYIGVESIRKEIHQEFDPETNALRSTSELMEFRKDYYYEKPEVKVLSLITNGEKKNPSSFRVYKMKPIYPVFDGNSSEHYELNVTDKQIVDRKECYRIQVTPKEKTSRHFKGDVFCTVDTLEPVYTEGTLAKLDFPIREFWLGLNTRLLQGIPVVTSGTIRVRVRVPIFFPDTLIVTRITVLENKPIKATEKER